MRTRLLPAVLLLALATACGGGDEEAGGSGSSDYPKPTDIAAQLDCQDFVADAADDKQLFVLDSGACTAGLLDLRPGLTAIRDDGGGH